MTKPIRVRFAPSPTGCLHIGGVRTALYNYLFARKHNGTFILRIEDTDQKRYVPGAEDYIIESLKWLGLSTDEDPMQGGSSIHYRQSERTEIYQKYIKILIDSGNAYYAFDTPEELETMRERLLAAKIPSPKYNVVTREHMKNSLVLPQNEVDELIKNGTPYVIRLKTTHKQDIRFNDVVRGWIKVSSEELEDKVLIKSDGIPTYHFANVVDDHLMEITHVIRGEEWISSTPMHILLYQSFGWQDTMPQFVHLPLLLKPNGEGKLSKRDASLGFPVFPISWDNPETGEPVIGFREEGYLPEALLNFLALMGWNPGTNQDVFTLDELIKEFSLEKIGKAGAKFDINKAKWLNGQHIRLMDKELLAEKVLNSLKAIGISATLAYVNQICDFLKERATFVQDIVNDARVFFEKPQVYDLETVKEKWNPQIAETIIKFSDLLKNLDLFNPVSIKDLFSKIALENNIKVGQLMPVLRLTISGTKSGPDLMQMIYIMGREEACNRINTACNILN